MRSADARATRVRWSKILLTIVALALAGFALDWRLLLENFSRLTPLSLGSAASFSLLTLLSLAARWHVFVRPLSGQSLRASGLQFLAASVYNLVTPAALGADAYRVLALRRASHGTAGPVGLIMAERICGLAGYAATFLICVAAARAEIPAALRGLAAPAGVLVVAVVVGLAVGPHALDRLGRIMPGRLHSFAEAFSAGLRVDLARLFPAVMLTFLGCFLWAGAAWSLASPIAPMGFYVIAAIATLSEIARWIPLTVQGIGVRESVFAIGFELAGYEAGLGFLIGAVLYGIHTLVLLAVGGIAALASTSIRC